MNVWWIIVLPLALSGFALGLIYDDGVRGTRDGQLAATVAIESVGVTPKQQRRSGETRLNPVQRITLACEQPGRVQRMHDLDEILRSLTLQELRDAAPGVLAIRESRRDALIALFSRWVELDPADAAEFAVTRASYAAWGTDYFLTIWSKVDMDAALRWYCARRPPVHEEQVLPLQVFREKWQEPARAFEWILGLPDDLARGKPWMLAQSAEYWAKKDPASAMERVARLENTIYRAQAMNAVMVEWARTDMAHAKAWLLQLSDEQLRRELTPKLIEGIASKDVNAALSMARSLPTPSERDGALVMVARSVASNDRAAANDVVVNIALAENVDLQKYFSDWLSSDVTGAAVQTLLARAEKNVEEFAAVQKLLESDEGNRWEAKASALGEVNGVRDDDYRRVILENTAKKWATNDLSKARAWAESLAEGSARERAFAGIAAGWTNSSVNEVTSWLDALPPSRSRDAAVTGFARKILPREPSAAIAWLRSIPDQISREKALAEAWKEWMRRDRSAADLWLDTSNDVTKAERASLNRVRGGR
jgi:hypothetical protein